MARIQVLPLTTETLGPASTTPFVIIIDKVTDDEKFGPLFSQDLSAAIGARLVLVYDGTLTVENVDQALHDAAASAVERALYPERSIAVP